MESKNIELKKLKDVPTEYKKIYPSNKKESAKKHNIRLFFGKWTYVIR